MADDRGVSNLDLRGEGGSAFKWHCWKQHPGLFDGLNGTAGNKIPACLTEKMPGE